MLILVHAGLETWEDEKMEYSLDLVSMRGYREFGWMPTFGYKSNMVIVSLEYEKRTEDGKSADGSDVVAYDLRAPSLFMVISA